MVKQPIRVYAGLRSAGSANERAALAVRELERPDPGWRHPRVLYMHHPSDSVGNATLEPFWRRPEKTDRP